MPTLTLILLFFLKIAICFNTLEIKRAVSASERILKGQMIIGSQYSQIENYMNYQYYVDLYIGTPAQQFSLILDTGSPYFWIPAKNCSNCPKSKSRFDQNRSLSYVSLQKQRQIQYGKGRVAGFTGMEIIQFEGMRNFIEIMLADEEYDGQGMKADGIMGLSNDKKISNLLDAAYSKGSLISPLFGFKLGIQELKQPSLFYYNISPSDFPNATYLPATRRNYWTIPIRQFRVDDVTYNISEALIDTGTSLILLPPKHYQKLDNQVFSKYCQPYSSLRKCACPNANSGYPNLTIMTTHLSLDLTPHLYIRGGLRSQNCYLTLDKLDSLSSFMILGDMFLHHHEVIFDKENNRIGFINNHRVLTGYVEGEWMSWIGNAIGLGVILSIGGMIIGLKKKQRDLDQPLTQNIQMHP